MSYAIALDSNSAWLLNQFVNRIEPKIKSHLPLTPDEVDLLVEYHEVRDNEEMEGKVEEAREEGYENGCEDGGDQAESQIKSDIEEQLSDAVDKFGDTKVACLAIIKSLVEDIVWLRMQQSTDDVEFEHFKEIRAELAETDADDDGMLDFIEDVNKHMFDEFRADIQFNEIEHAFHRVF